MISGSSLEENIVHVYKYTNTQIISSFNEWCSLCGSFIWQRSSHAFIFICHLFLPWEIYCELRKGGKYWLWCLISLLFLTFLKHCLFLHLRPWDGNLCFPCFSWEGGSWLSLSYHHLGKRKHLGDSPWVKQSQAWITLGWNSSGKRPGP